MELNIVLWSFPHSKRHVCSPFHQVAVPVLDGLIQAASQSDSTFDVTGVVSQPARPSGRGSRRSPLPSPVAQAAARAGIPQDRILTPERAGDAGFLDALRSLHPDLLVTAAYGNYLPTRLLGIPRQGTLNIHPSLLPAYRGAAPVQRALMVSRAVKLGALLCVTGRHTLSCHVCLFGRTASSRCP